MSKLTQFRISEITAELDEPFSIANVARVDDILVGVYLCQGMLEWHRHVDVDELFWVYDGVMLLETERGDVRMEPGELSVVPKGTRHRSSSPDRATVLLLRCGFLAHRKNGKRRLYAVDDCGPTPIDLRERSKMLAAPFRFRTVAQIEGSMVQIARGGGRWPVELPVAHDRMFYVLDGALTVRTVRSRTHLGSGEFTVVPRGAFYHLHSAEKTLLARVTRGVL